MAEEIIPITLTITTDEEGKPTVLGIPEELTLAIGDTIKAKVFFPPEIGDGSPVVEINGQTFPLQAIAPAPPPDDEVAAPSPLDEEGESITVPESAEEGEHDFRIVVGGVVAFSGRIKIIRQHG